ncbi:hypothetical protein PSPO01_03356 [Paraphaeosphaeria sporulosa]
MHQATDRRSEPHRRRRGARARHAKPAPTWTSRSRSGAHCSAKALYCYRPPATPAAAEQPQASLRSRRLSSVLDGLFLCCCAGAARSVSQVAPPSRTAAAAGHANPTRLLARPPSNTLQPASIVLSFGRPKQTSQTGWCVPRARSRWPVFPDALRAPLERVPAPYALTAFGAGPLEPAPMETRMTLICPLVASPWMAPQSPCPGNRRQLNTFRTFWNLVQYPSSIRTHGLNALLASVHSYSSPKVLQ